MILSDQAHSPSVEITGWT